MTTQLIRNVIVAGAGGTIGAPITAGLLASGKFNVSVLTRTESASTFPAGVIVKKADLSSHASLVEALKDQDAFICTLNDFALGVQEQLIDAAFEAGVKRFIPNEWGVNEMDSHVTELQEALNGRRSIIELLKYKSAEATKAGNEFHWTGVNNGLFFDWALHAAFIDITLPPAKTAVIWDSGANQFSGTNLATVAAAVVSILSTAESETRDRFVWIESFVLSQNSIVQALEEATGEKWNITKTTTEQELAKSRTAYDSGDVLGGFYRWIMAGMFTGNPHLAFKGDKLDNKLLGLKEKNLLETVKEIVATTVA